MSNENTDTSKTHGYTASTATTAPRMSYQTTADSIATSTYYGPLAHVNTASTTLPAFGGEMQPGLWKGARQRELANPAPLGLFGFALTTFILGCIEMGARDITQPNIVVGPAMAYGGLVQLCAGMWYVLFFLVSQDYELDQVANEKQGNGCWKHLWCHCALVVQWAVDLAGHHFHPWRIQCDGYVRKSGWWSWHVL